MSFTWKKFESLSLTNKIKKTAFAILQSLQNSKDQSYAETFLHWLNQSEKTNIPIPKHLYDWQMTYERLLQLLEQNGINIDEKLFDKPQGEYHSIPLELVLDNIRSPYNVGAIMRTAECFGVRKVYLTGITPTPDTHPKIKKTLRGAPMPYLYVQNNIQCIMDLKKSGFYIYCIEKDGNSIPINSAAISYPAVLLFGNEEFGLSPEIQSMSDAILEIPLMGTKNSLNVSVTAGIALYSVVFPYRMF